MRQWRVGTLSMGILLVALGAIMLFSQISGVSAIEQIIKWWPVILIMLGLEILVYVFLSKQDQPKVKFDVFSIFIIILIMIFSIVTYAGTNILNGNISSSIHPIFNFHKYESSFKKDYTINAEGKEHLAVHSSFGNVVIEKGALSKIEIEANITMQNNDEEYSKSIVDSLIEITEGDTIKIKSKSSQYLNNSKVQNISINYFIKVPDKMNVEVQNKFGDVSVEGILLSANIDNSNGNITTKSIGGDLTVKNSFGNVDSDGVGGKGDIRCNNGNLSISKVGGSLDIKNSFGDIKINEVKGSACVSSNNGRIDINKIDGDVTMDGRFCEINTGDVEGNLEVEDNNANITLRNIGGDVKASNRFGNIDLTNANKSVTLKDNNGNISFDTDKLVEKDADIQNSFGNITLKVPKDQQGNFKASTEFGNIKSQFDLNIDKDSNKQSLDGNVGDGKIKFYLRNRNGDINLDSN